MRTKNFKNLLDPKNKEALFFDYNKEVVIELSESIRTNKIGIRPFIEDSGLFGPTVGSYYPSLFFSNNGKNYTFVGKFPSTYGVGTDDYVTKFFLSGGYNSIKFIKITTDYSSQLSISHLELE